MKKIFCSLIVLIIAVSCDNEGALTKKAGGALLGLVRESSNSGGKINDAVLGLYKISEDGSMEEIPNFFSNPYFETHGPLDEIRIDGQRKKVYCITSGGSGQYDIARLNFDGTGLEILYDQSDTESFSWPGNLIIDPNRNMIYWTRITPVGTDGNIDFYSASMDGDQESIQLIESNVNFYHSCIDPASGKIYSATTTDGIIVRDVSNLNHVSLLFQLDLGQDIYLYGLVIDASRNKLFVVTSDQRILSGNLNGTGTLEEIYRAPIIFPDEEETGRYIIYMSPVCDAYNNKLYWTEESPYFPWNDPPEFPRRLMSLDLNTRIVSEVIPAEWLGNIYWADNW